MSHHPHAPALPYCRNCHFTLATPRPVYCGHCGQETDLHPPSVREMLTEYVGHYVALDGPLWRTLWALICLPGFLTIAYFRGQRRRYVLPLRVYLSASFVFFVGWALLPHDTQAVSTSGAQVEKAVDEAVEPARTHGDDAKRRAKRLQSPAELAAAAASAAGREKSALDAPLGCSDDKPDQCSTFERTLSHLITKGASLTADNWATRFRALAPYCMLAMQPLFAALLLLMFAGRGRRYAEHFVFSLHSHSLWFLALLLVFTADAAGLATFVVFIHGMAALRRVYGLSWFGALWRGLLLTAGYFVLLLVVLAAFGAGVAALA
ncbi:MAG: DUF3667 domain-containing protein [Rubrivivax sp.]|nr:MAG: DUF3667 domain-containing protein [Rubrivivax sp.]